MPNNLDALQQVIASMLVVIIGGSIAFVGFTKKWLDKLSPAAEPKNNDAVVISGAFADTRPIKVLSESIERLNTLMGRVADSNERLCAAIDAQSRASMAVSEGARQKIESDMRLITELQMLAQAMNRQGERK